MTDENEIKEHLQIIRELNATSNNIFPIITRLVMIVDLMQSEIEELENEIRRNKHYE